MNHGPHTVNADFAATFCHQLHLDGLRAAFVAPGSRSTPLALALTEHPGIAVEIFHDERSASFAALGYGLATGVPGLVLCSSGTAGAHFYAAAIEADASAVPMVLCTADRPPELWNRGAPQTIDQTEMYGNTVRDFVQPGPADELDRNQWRPLARRLWTSATEPVPGPVHANLSFRDPLTGTAAELPPPIEAFESAPHPTPAADVISAVGQAISVPQGVIVAGRGQSNASDVLRLSDKLGWPVLADHRSGCRTNHRSVVRHFDALLRDENFGRNHRPDVVLRIGEIVSSKALSQWLSASAEAGTVVVSGRPYDRLVDPESIATLQFSEQGMVSQLADMADVTPDPEWLRRWSDADQLASTIIDADTSPNRANPSEIRVAQHVVHAVPPGGALMMSSSMPVRDIEWYGPNRDDISVYANRGANGIDGIVATAIGIALAGRQTICLIGDVAFLHDVTSLTALRNRPIDLTIVVVDNDGGGIFSFLPQHELLDAAAYETLFGTPHGTDIEGLVRAHGLPVEHYDSTAIDAPSGIKVVIVHSDRAANLNLHNQLNQAVAQALHQQS